MPNMDKTLSIAFDRLRFPLAILVIYLHIDHIPTHDLIAATNFTGTQGLELYYRIVYSVCLIANCAVPCFFFMSGYLIVNNLTEFSWQSYYKKISNRFFTLFIPYIIWNILAGLYIWFVVGTRFDITSIFIDPINFPLWFLRNLIVLDLLLPLWWVMNKYFKSFGLILVSAVYLFYTHIPYINNYAATALFYFYFGIYCNRRFINIGHIPKASKYLIAIIAIGTYIAQIIWWQYNLYYIHRLFLVAGVMTILIMSYRYSAIKGELKYPLLASAAFFIYASHKVGPTAFAKLPLNYILPDNPYSSIIIFLVAPLFTAGICLTIYRIAKKYSPRFLMILSGR